MSAMLGCSRGLDGLTVASATSGKRELGLALLPKPSQSRLETQHLANMLATKNHPK
jgi:hypothetical protein